MQVVLNGLIAGSAIALLAIAFQIVYLPTRIFFVGLAASLWSANAGTGAMFDALTVVHGEREKRGLVRLNALALAFTAGAILLILAALTAVVGVPIFLQYVGLGEKTDDLLRFGRWPALFLLIAMWLALVYRYGPCRTTPRWRWITLGSAFGTLGWLSVSLLFSVIFRSTATSALCALGLWLFFFILWPQLASAIFTALGPSEIRNLDEYVAAQSFGLALMRLSPGTLFTEAVLGLLNPETRTLGPMLPFQMRGAIMGAPLPLGQSLLLIWPQITGLIAGMIVVFAAAYVIFQREEVRA